MQQVPPGPTQVESHTAATVSIFFSYTIFGFLYSFFLRSISGSFQMQQPAS
jgi:hypothetical protein